MSFLIFYIQQHCPHLTTCIEFGRTELDDCRQTLGHSGLQSLQSKFKEHPHQLFMPSLDTPLRLPVMSRHWYA